MHDQTYSAAEMNIAYKDRLFSDNRLVQKFTSHLHNYIILSNNPKPYFIINDTLTELNTLSQKHFNYDELCMLRSESIHDKLRKLGYQVTIEKQTPCDLDEGESEDLIKLTWDEK